MYLARDGEEGMRLKIEVLLRADPQPTLKNVRRCRHGTLDITIRHTMVVCVPSIHRNGFINREARRVLLVRDDHTRAPHCLHRPAAHTRWR